MPLVPQENPFETGQLSPEGLPAPLPEPDEPRLGETVGAAFRIQNSLTSFLNDAESTGLMMEGYEPLDDIAGYENHAESFFGSRHPEDTARIKAQIDREMLDREVLQNSGVTGFIAELAAGVTDPIYLPLMLIPGSQLVKGGASLATAGKFAALGAGSEALAEAAKHGTQEVRALDESVVNVTAAALLSGLVGGAASKLLTREQRKEFTARIADELIQEERSGSVGAAQVEGMSMEDLEIESALGLEKLPVSPVVRLSNAGSRTARELAHSLVENPLLVKGAKKGLSPVPEGGAIETRIKQWDGNLDKALTQIDEQYAAYRTRVKGQNDRLSKREFYEQVARSGRRNDGHIIDEVAAAAIIARSNVYNPLKNAAVKAGIFDEDINVTTADSYQRRVYNTGKIVQERDQWYKIVVGWIANE